MTNKKSKANLERKMGLGAVIGLGVGATVGSGIFSSISSVAGAAGSSLFLVLSFAIATILQIPGSFCFIELTSAYPEDGGHYIYLKEAGFKLINFVMGWATFLALDAPSISVMALAIANYLTVFFHCDFIILKIVVICIVLILAFLNIRSVKAGSDFQAAMTLIKILPFIIIVGLGAFFINPDLFLSSEFTTEFSSESNSNMILSLMGSVALCYFSCDGMFSSCYVSGEIKKPNKTLPKGILLSAIIVMVLYVLLSGTATGLMSIGEIANSKAPIAEMASRIPVVGNIAGPAIAIVAIIVIMGTISSCLLYMPRFEYAMAKDGLFFKALSKVHPKYKTPSWAISIFTAYSIILIIIGNIESLLGSVAIIILLKYAFTYLTIFILRRKSSYKPTYKAPGNYLMPVIALVSTTAILVFSIISATTQQIIFNVIIVIFGIIAYYIWKHFNK